MMSTGSNDLIWQAQYPNSHDSQPISQLNSNNPNNGDFAKSPEEIRNLNITDLSENEDEQEIDNNFNFFNSTGQVSGRHAFVSLFFPILDGPQRHSTEDYGKRVRKLFEFFHGELYFYTNDLGENITLGNKKPPPNVHIVKKYQNPLDFPKIAHNYLDYLEIDEKYSESEKYIHSAMIGAIWNAKIEVIREVAHMDKNYSYIYWIDAGLIKRKEYDFKNLTFPNERRLEMIFNSFPKEKMIFSSKKITLKRRVRLKQMKLSDYSFIFACFFGGPRKAVLKFVRKYYRLHDHFLAKKEFVLREEFILSVYGVLYRFDCMFYILKESNCYAYHAAAGFIADENICNFSNAIYTFEPFLQNLVLKEHQLPSWK